MALPPSSLSSRVDLIGCPYIWVASVAACDILPCPFSDHCTVVLSVFVPSVIPPGPGLCLGFGRRRVFSSSS